MCEFDCVFGFDINRVLSAYGGLCGRWVGADVDAGRRGTHQRFFKSILALPLAAAFAMPAALLAGMTVQAAFAALAALSGAALALASFVSMTARLRTGLFGMAAMAGGMFSLVVPLTGLLALLPLAVLAGTEVFFITRKPADSTAVAALAVLVCAAFAGVSAETASTPAALALAALSLAYLAALPFRALSGDGLAQPTRAVLAEAVLDAAGALRAKVRLTGELFGVEGACGEGFGIAPKLLEGFGLFERIPVGDRLAYLTALDAVRAGGAMCEAQIRLQGADLGAFIHARVSFCRLDGDVLGLCLQRAEAPAAEPALPVSENKVKADRYLAGVSHELRTPLNAILGFSDILRQEMFGPLANDRQREYVGLIHQSGAHLLEVVNMILDVSKLDAGAYEILSEPFEVEDAVSISAAMVREQAAAKGVALDCAIGKGAAECVGDRRAVQQILINLLSNAVKFTPKGGSVRLSAEAADACLVFTVADTGIGMSEGDLAKIGQPFFQAQNDYSRAFEGTGLGLSLVRGLVELHGGGLSVESALGAGTSVTVRLPLNGQGKSARGGTVSQLVNLDDKRLGAAVPQKAGATAQGDRHEPAIRKTA